MLPTHNKIIKDIYLFIDEQKISPSVFGRKYFGDSGFVTRLKKGVDPRYSTVLKIYRIIGDKQC